MLSMGMENIFNLENGDKHSFHYNIFPHNVKGKKQVFRILLAKAGENCVYGCLFRQIMPVCAFPAGCKQAAALPFRISLRALTGCRTPPPPRRCLADKLPYPLRCACRARESSTASHASCIACPASCASSAPKMRTPGRRASSAVRHSDAADESTVPVSALR